MIRTKYLILGAGPAGLSFSNRLLNNGEDSFLVLEAESEAGGLCRSKMIDGSPLDIGGGHFLDVRCKEVCEFLFQFMPEKEWNLYNRDSRIALGNNMIGHPLEANIWQLPQEEQVEYLKSIAVAGCNLGTEMPEKFVDWIYWKLGKKIAEEYMLPYNQKMFGENLDLLGTYWLEKLPNVSFEETLLSCLNQKPYGKQPGHAQFYYPKETGYGEVWLRMAKKIEGQICCNSRVKTINVHDRIVEDINGRKYQAEYIISTIPWNSVEFVGIDEKCIVEGIAKLRHTGVEIAYFMEDQESDAQWIYVPDIDISYHRILSRKTFCPGSHGYWTETNLERIDGKEKQFAYSNEYAYPLNTIDKQDIMNDLLAYMAKRKMYGLGRWGEHKHYNSDVVVEKAIQLADIMMRG